MNNKKELLEKAQLYCVLDAQVAGYDRLFDILDRSADAGTDVFQIRDKRGSAREIIQFTKRSMARLKGERLFIVNDHLDIALIAGADGVHVGQDDISIGEARRMGGRDFIIGASCQTLAQAIDAQRQGADYIGFGSVFKTLTKPERPPMDLQLLKDVLRQVSIPVFPIGGITAENLHDLKECGVKRLAVTRAICLADDIDKAVYQLKNNL
jgi:thiamine-phosphate diphosphorylase